MAPFGPQLPMVNATACPQLGRADAAFPALSLVNRQKLVRLSSMLDGAVNNSRKQRGRPFRPGTSGNRRGRPRGARNKRTIADQEIIASGISPLAFLCSVFRNEKQPMKRRIEAARCAAPYVHPRLSVTPFSPLQSESDQAKSFEVSFVYPPKPPE